MKIGVMLRHIDELGGIVVYTKNLIESLLELDRSNQYIFIYNNPISKRYSSIYPNVKEIVIRFPNKLLWDQYLVKRVIEKEKIDIIFNPKLSIPVFSTAKTVLTMHGLEQFAVSHIFKKLDRLYFTLMMPIYCRFADAIISMTETGKRDLIKYLKVKGDKIYVINEAYNKRFRVIEDKVYLQGVRERYKLPPQFVLFVGGLTPLKNFSNILRAIKYLKESLGIRVKLVSVGFKRWKYESDLRLIADLGLTEDIVMLGFIPDEDMPAIYNMASCFVFPSLYEGFGIPVLEAQACGCPVITSNTGALPEVSGGACLLVDPYNYIEIAESIRRIFNDGALREDLIREGLKNVERFSWERCAKETLNLFKKIYEG